MAATTIKPGMRKAIGCGIAALTLPVLLLPVLLQQAHAAAWLIEPSIEVRETYSDNVGLSAQGQKQGDLVTEYLPRVKVTGVGRRLRLNADYTLDALFYLRDGTRNNIQHQLYSDMNAELMDDLLYFDGRASISQQNASLFGPLITDNIQASANRAEVRTLSMSPYLRRHFGRYATGELRYARDVFKSNSGALMNTTSDRASMLLNSGPAFSALGWGLQYNEQKSDYENSGETAINTYSASLRYALGPTFALTATGGNESYSYGSGQDASEGPMWTAGFAWNPSTRTSVSASAGRRFYGNTYALDASFRTRRSVWALTYKEDITTTQAQFQLDTALNTATFLDGLWKTSIPDAAARQEAVAAFIRDTGLPRTINAPVSSFTNRFFLQKSLQGSLALNGVKNTIVLSIYDTRREAQGGIDVNALPTTGPRSLLDADDSRQRGVHGLWRWRLSSNLNANLSLGLNRISSESLDRQDTNKTARLALTHQFSRKLKGSVELRRLQSDSSVAGASTRENALAASFTADF